MVKKQKKRSITSKKQQERKAVHTTIAFGYVLFFVGLVSALIPTILWSRAVFIPNINPFTVLVLLFSSVVSFAIPLVVAYFLGDKATKAASHQTHHYNGVLFAIAGYWVSLAYTMVSTYVYFNAVMNMVLQNILFFAPAIATALTLVPLGIAYAKRTKHQIPLARFVPYTAVLWAAILVLFVGMIVQYVFNPYDQFTISWSSISVLLLPVVGIGIFFGIGYWRTRHLKSTKGERALKSLIATTFGLLAVTIAAEALGYIPIVAISMHPNPSLYGLGIGTAVWLWYLLRSPDFK
jgi:hypothetical protein